jgi:hypothetical protein
MKEKSHKASEISFVSSLAEASFLLRRVAEPRPAGDSVKAALSRAWRRLPGWSFNRIRDVWHADHRIRISADELDQLRRTAHQKAEHAARDEYRELLDRIARIEVRLAAQDADFHSPQIDALKSSVCGLGGKDRALD